MHPIITWLVAFMLKMHTPGVHTSIVDARETAEEGKTRYSAIAKDLVDVVFDDHNSPLFRGESGRLKTAMTLASIMSFESSFRRDVDLGLGPKARGDSGRSWCLLQIQVGKGRTWKWNRAKDRFAYVGDNPADLDDGWTGEELVQDRRKCILTGLRMAQQSVRVCHHLPTKDWLRLYASGSCEMGGKQSQARMGTAMWWFREHPPKLTDAEVLSIQAMQWLRSTDREHVPSMLFAVR